MIDKDIINTKVESLVNTRSLFLEVAKRLKQDEHNSKLFLDRDFNIVFEFDAKLDEKFDFSSFPSKFLYIIEVSDVVIVNITDCGYKKIIKNRFINYDVNKYEIRHEI